MTCHDVAERIDAYIDNELAPAEAAALAQHVATCAACRQLLQEREGLRRLLRTLPYYRAPDRLESAVVSQNRPARVSPRVWAWAAAAVLVIAVGSATGLSMWQTRRATSTIAGAVVEQHVAALSADHLIDVVSSNQHTVKPWFQGKLDFSPPVPDLTAEDFPLAGGRVDTLNARTVAALVYHRRLHVINVFIWPADDRAAAADARTIRGFHERHWQQGGMSMWAVSDVNDADLAAFVQAFKDKS